MILHRFVGMTVRLTLKNYKKTSTTNTCWDRTKFIANVHKLTSKRALPNMGNTTKYGYDKFTKINTIQKIRFQYLVQTAGQQKIHTVTFVLQKDEKHSNYLDFISLIYVSTLTHECSFLVELFVHDYD